MKHSYPFMIVQNQYQTEQILEDCLSEKGIGVDRNMELIKLTSQAEHTNLDLKNLNDNSISTLQTSGIVIGQMEIKTR